jgi:hypothetical protein
MLLVDKTFESFKYRNLLNYNVFKDPNKTAKYKYVDIQTDLGLQRPPKGIRFEIFKVVIAHLVEKKSSIDVVKNSLFVTLRLAINHKKNISKRTNPTRSRMDAPGRIFH